MGCEGTVHRVGKFAHRGARGLKHNGVDYAGLSISRFRRVGIYLKY